MSQNKNYQTGHIAVIASLVLVVVVVGLIGWQTAKAHKKSVTSASKPLNQTSAKSSTVSNSADQAGLSRDLQSVNNSMNQENTDSNTANAGLNDQQSQVSVPTN